MEIAAIQGLGPVLEDTACDPDAGRLEGRDAGAVAAKGGEVPAAEPAAAEAGPTTPTPDDGAAGRESAA